MAKDYQFWLKEAEDGKNTEKEVRPPHLIKMKDVVKILQASPPTIRRYARLGYYKEYRLGEKLVFYDKEEIINYILSAKK